MGSAGEKFVPSDWQVIIPIPKGSDTNEWKNYREITLFV